MRYLFILMLFCSHNTEPEGMDYRPVYHEAFGEPCSTTTDIIEQTCELEVRKPGRRRK